LRKSASGFQFGHITFVQRYWNGFENIQPSGAPLKLTRTGALKGHGLKPRRTSFPKT
jgi:hypothetical protein